MATPLEPLIIDVESYYSTVADERYPRNPKYSLSHMTTESYIRDPRFELHGAAVKWSKNTNARWYAEKELRYVLKEHDWSNTFLICHHHQWDGYALAHHYGIRPKMRGCTLAMARCMIGNHISVSLESVRKHFGLLPKTTPYNLFVNKHWHELSPGEQEQVADGACDEAESIWKIFGLLLARGFPREELEVIHITMEMFCNPMLLGDIPYLMEVYKRENERKKRLLVDLGLQNDSELQSSEKFAALLRAEGVEPATKVSPKGNTLYHFGKNDPFMKQLEEEENDRVRMLAEARLGAKSTLVQTRAKTIALMASRGPLCVYLRPFGAHTSRFGTGDGSNFQNLTPELNKAICAPEGYLIAAPDASQVECRITNFIAGQVDKIDDFRNGRDPYVGVATAFYGYPVNKTEHPTERQVGKVLELQCGFGSGAEKIRATLRTKADILITPEEALKARDAYRHTHPCVVDMWKQGGRMLARLAGGDPLDWGPVHIREHKMILPNGVPLDYSTLEYYKDDESGDSYWRLKMRNGWARMHGPKLFQNLVQALARLLITQAMIRIHRLGYKIVGMKHDDVWILIPKDGREEQHLETCKAEMRREPTWLPGLPLDCEGQLGVRYSK